MKTLAVLLAAGRGSRMSRRKNKVLEKVSGKPIILHLKDALCDEQIDGIYVVVSPNSEIPKVLGEDVNYCTQIEPLGTGDALRCACENFTNLDAKILVLNGDGPIIDKDTLRRMLQVCSAVGILTANLETQNSYGKIIRNGNGDICGITELKDCSEELRILKEVNLGVYFFDNKFLQKNINNLKNENAQNEYYLTDLIEKIYAQGGKIESVSTKEQKLMMSVNTIPQLLDLERVYHVEKCLELMNNGVRIFEPNCTFIESTVSISSGTDIYPNCYIGGKTKVAENCLIYPNSVIFDCEISPNSIINPGSVLINKKL